MKTYLLENWSVYRDPWKAPEVAQSRLVGFRNGDHILTSPIATVEGRKITTLSGSVYLLGEIDPQYLVWMQEHGYTYNPDQPIALKN